MLRRLFGSRQTLSLIAALSLPSLIVIFGAGCGEECSEVGAPCCDNACFGTGLSCFSGVCRFEEEPEPDTCGLPGLRCCPGLSCSAPYECDDSGFCDVSRTQTDCGGDGERCCTSGTECDSAGFVCERQLCTRQECGKASGPCCTTGTPCERGLTCTSNTCESATVCGAVGESCCPGNSCESGVCCGGVCVNTQADSRHCGSCGRGCSGGDCDAGVCGESCGGEGQTCCADGVQCSVGTTCEGGTCVAEMMGCELSRDLCGSGCCAGLDCSNVFEEDRPIEDPFREGCCAPKDGPCTDSLECCGWLSCDTIRGICEPTAAGRRCVTGSNNECGPGLRCIEGMCSTGETTVDCGSITDCGACNTTGGCGFCGFDNRCMAGDASGPSAGSCSDWRPSVAECATEVACSSLSTCEACADTEGCGFCNNGGGCKRGGILGPDDFSCGGVDWYTSGVLCPSGGSGCLLTPSCGDCTTRAGCGWCGDDDGFCTEGTELAPSVGECGNWQPEFCRAEPATTCGWLSCDQCAQDTDCGWCEGAGECMERSMQFTCFSGWATSGEMCPPPAFCSEHVTCGACQDSPLDCGWCAGSRTCMPGTADSPDIPRVCSEGWFFDRCGL